MEKKSLDEVIKGLETELKKDKNNSIILSQLKGLYELRELEKKRGKQGDKVTSQNLEREKKELIKEKEIVKTQGTATEYIEIEKKIKKINSKLRELRNEIQYFSSLEFKRLKASIRKNKKNGEKFLLMVLLAYECGLRVSEVADLKINDISIEDKTLLCRRVKGSNTNTIILTEITFRLLEKYIKKNKIINYLFTTRNGLKYTGIAVNKMFKLYCIKSKVMKSKQRFHCLKHSRAVHLANEGLTLQQIQYMLGHKSINSTMVYFRFTNTQEEDIYSKLKGY